MLKSFFLKIDYCLLKINFSRLSFPGTWCHSDGWLLGHTGLLWGLMQPSRWVVERQRDWTPQTELRLCTRHMARG